MNPSDLAKLREAAADPSYAWPEVVRDLIAELERVSAMVGAHGLMPFDHDECMCGVPTDLPDCARCDNSGRVLDGHRPVLCPACAGTWLASHVAELLDAGVEP